MEVSKPENLEPRVSRHVAIWLVSLSCWSGLIFWGLCLQAVGVPVRGGKLPPGYGVESINDESTPVQRIAYNRLMKDYAFLENTWRGFAWMFPLLLPGFFLQLFTHPPKVAVVFSVVGLSLHAFIGFIHFIGIGFRFG